MLLRDPRALAVTIALLAACGSPTTGAGPGGGKDPVAVASAWFRACAHGDVAGAMALSATPFSFDRDLKPTEPALRFAYEQVMPKVHRDPPLEISSATAIADPRRAHYGYVGPDPAPAAVELLIEGEVVRVFVRRADLKVIGFRD